jgi:seryl-tRNA synthetase
MIDIRIIRANPQLVVEGAKKKGIELDITPFLALDEKRREDLYQVEQLKNKRNVVSEEIGRMKKAGQNAEVLMAEMKEVSQRIKEMDEDIRMLDEKIQDFLLIVPNIPHESVPIGEDESSNIEIRKWGEPRKFNFKSKAHWEIGVDLDILDFERAAKISGARFTVYKGLGARLERAIMQFYLDIHTSQHGYTEIFPPFLVNTKSMIGTANLPKFEEDLFKCREGDYYLIPTAEVPVTNLHRDEIIDEDDLPICYAAYSACFRAEAGAAGRDTRGLIRQHQFNKVELVKFTTPESSLAELEKLTHDAERVLQLLELPYHVLSMCTGDMGFAQYKKYDLEVWLPSYDTYREISSCSNFADFQARRANIKYRPKGGKPEFLHTLNGSGVAIGRTVAAILENYQEADGSVIIPKALRPYMFDLERIEKK